MSIIVSAAAADVAEEVVTAAVFLNFICGLTTSADAAVLPADPLPGTQ